MLQPDLSGIACSPLMGGSGSDFATDIEPDGIAGSARVAGYSSSIDFPMLPSGPASAKFGPGGGYDGFVDRLASLGAAIERRSA